MRPVWMLAAALLCALAGAASSLAQSAAPAVPDILVSRQLMAAQGVRVGDVVSLSAESSGAHPRPFRVAGEYEPTPDPMQLGAARLEVRMHLPDLIDVAAKPADPLAAETIDAINVALSDPGAARDVGRQLSSAVPEIGRAHV